MNLQTFKPSVNKIAGVAAIFAAILLSVPALAGSGNRQTSTPAKPTTTDAKPVSSPSDAPVTVPSTEVSPGTMPSTTQPKTPTSEAPTSPDASSASGTIVDVASSSGSFKTLVEAVKAAGLTDELSGKGPFTVFAPTDAAFAALPKGTVEMLLKPENKEALKKVLTYHVVAGAVDSGTLKSGQVKTVEGSSVKVRVSGSNVTVNDAKVTSPDIKASNGVIHVIDKVIIPPDM
ncbi:MAG: fasciclin domain-containing protein [Kovacikia sp.]